MVAEVGDQCITISNDCSQEIIIIEGYASAEQEPCMTVTVIASHTVSYAPSVVTMTPTRPTTTTVITQYSSIIQANGNRCHVT